MKRRIIALSLAMVMILGASTACSKQESTVVNNETQAQSSEDPTTAPADNGGTDATAAPDENTAKLGPMTPGCLYILKGGAVISSVALTGNIAGSEDFNSTQPVVDGIRNVFELSEWVEIYLTTKTTDSVQVFVFKQNDDSNVYNDYKYDEELPNLVTTAELSKPEDETGSWGSFYLSPEEADPGFYDIVFVCGGQPVAVMKVKFYAENELSSKSDDELRSLMKSIQN